MEELVKWLNEDDSLLLDPIERAAIAHYKLVWPIRYFLKILHFQTVYNTEV